MYLPWLTTKPLSTEFASKTATQRVPKCEKHEVRNQLPFAEQKQTRASLLLDFRLFQLCFYWPSGLNQFPTDTTILAICPIFPAGPQSLMSPMLFPADLNSKISNTKFRSDHSHNLFVKVGNCVAGRCQAFGLALNHNFFKGWLRAGRWNFQQETKKWLNDMSICLTWMSHMNYKFKLEPHVRWKIIKIFLNCYKFKSLSGGLHD